jgi:hypothetical protein
MSQNKETLTLGMKKKARQCKPAGPLKLQRELLPAGKIRSIKLGR